MSEAGVLDDALDRLHQTGPEFQGRLSNHGPMVVEAMVRRGHSDDVMGWLNWYATKLEGLPDPIHVLDETNWIRGLGDPKRLGDWIAFFTEQFKNGAWNEVLIRWWPQLLPGLAASATHSVIRVGHAVEALRDEGPSEVRVAELAQAMAYWAARWLPIGSLPSSVRTTGTMDVARALANLSRLDNDAGAFPELLARLDSLQHWPVSVAALRSAATPDDARDLLKDVVTQATFYYGSRDSGDEIMVVHAATAPNAVLRVLPSLPTDLWIESQQAAWVASAAVVTMYDAPIPAHGQQPVPVHTVEETFALAVERKDEHVIKLADTALDVYGWTSDERALAAAHRAAADIVD